MFYHYCLLLFSLLFACAYVCVPVAHGQSSRSDKIQVTGRVLDTTGAAIERATIRLFAGVDTVRAATDADGRFSAYVARHPDSLVRIWVAHLAYDPLRKDGRVAASDSTAYDFGRLILTNRSITINEVAVERRPAIMFRGDTIFFETDHIKVAEGAYTEDLMSRIPGMLVDGQGRLSYQGRQIEHVRLNGIDFFGGDVALALRNLPADLILRLQLIEDHGEHYHLTGIRSDSPTHILNLEVDDDNTRGKFTTGRTGYGTDRTRVLSVGGNFFNKEKQASLAFGNNNIADPVRYTASRPELMGLSGGIITTSGVSATYADRLSEQVKGYLFYALNRVDNDQLSRSTSTKSYGDASEIATDREQRNHTRTIVHDIGQLGVQNTLEWNAGDRRSRLSFRPIFKHEVTETTGLDRNDRSFYDADILASSQTTHSLSEGRDLLRSAQFVLNGSHRFKNGHSTTLHINVILRGEKGHEQLVNQLAQRDVGNASVVDSLTEQMIDKVNRNINWTITQNYTIPVTETDRLTLGAQFNQIAQRGSRDVYDQLKDDLRVDSLGSRKRLDQRRTGLNANLTGTLRKTWSYTIGGEMLFFWQSMEDDLFAGRDMRHRTAYFAPALSLRNSGKRFQKSMRYMYRVIQPDFRALDPVPDYRGPEMIIYGNPDLKANLFHNLQVTMNTVPKPGTFATTRIQLTGGYHTNRIVQDVHITTDTDGLIKQEQFYRNLSGDFQLNGTSQSVLKTWELRSDEKFLFGSDSDLSFSKERFYEAGVIRQSYISGAKVSLSGMWQRPDALNIAAATYQVQHNSAPNLYGTSTIHALSAQLSFNQFIWKHLRVNGSLSKSFNWGYQGPANRDPFGVNLTVQGNLYKTNVTWSITANDLLDQLADQGRTVSRNEVIDYNNNTRGRYVLASINWRLGKFGGQW